MVWFNNRVIGGNARLILNIKGEGVFPIFLVISSIKVDFIKAKTSRGFKRLFFGVNSCDPEGLEPST
jgi:hypothetical protein